MILSRGSFRAHEIRDIIQLMFPAHYEGKVNYDRLVENVKHTLSRCHLFVKKPRTRGMPGKGGLWSYDPYAKPKARKNASRSRARRSAAPSASIASPAHTDTTELSQIEESFSVPSGPSVSSTDAPWFASPGVENLSFTYPIYVPETSSTPEWNPFVLFSENGHGTFTGDDVASQQWMSFPSTPVTEFGQAGLVQNTTPQSFRYLPTMSPGSLYDADAWPQQMHPYSALPYGSPQFRS
ncbi:hypothetical protein FRC04_012025 [Tulasnella sp. 424]|nr:hypothetical protein FRC04_012025 [Tulasnella sp. 424]KAG8971265.1 hypothetical protein FRC05_011364 [Tulasnella sp. 425]